MPASADTLGPAAPARTAEETAAKKKEAERLARVARREERAYEKQLRKEERRQKAEQKKQEAAQRKADKAAAKAARLEAEQIAPAALNAVQNAAPAGVNPLLATLVQNPVTDETSPPDAALDVEQDAAAPATATTSPWLSWPAIGLAALALIFFGRPK